MGTSAFRRLMTIVVLVGGIGSGCITIFDTFNIAVNVDGLQATFPLQASNSSSYSGSVLVRASDYISGDFATIRDVRIYDIRVRTTGTYSGDITGRVRVNGIEFASYSAPWSTLSTEQSLLMGGPITVDQAGMTVLINGILDERDLFVEIVGTVSDAPIPAGLQIHVRVLGQVDAEL